MAFAVLAPVARAQMSVTTEDRVAETTRVLSETITAGIGAPSKVALLDQATLRLTGALQFIPKDVAARYLRLFDRPVPPDLIGLLRFTDRVEWFAIVRFIGDGFVDPVQLKAWSAEDLLASLRDEVNATNPERERQGQSPLEVTRWLIAPRYDAARHAMEWAALTPTVDTVRQRDSSAEHNIAVFGRNGYVLIRIIGHAGELRETGVDYRTIVDNLRFDDGKTYDDYIRGRDRAAPNGIAGVLGVRALRRASLLEDQLDSDRIMILSVGGSLVAGAGLLGLALVVANRRRKRR